MRLASVNLPGWEPVTLQADKAVVLGRSSSCDVIIPDPRVSGRHAVLAHRNGRWTITDLASKHGVRVQGVAASPNAPVEVVAGDLIHLGPIALRLGEPAKTTTISRTYDDGPGTIVTPPTPATGPALTARMMEAIGGVVSAQTEGELAQRLADLTVELSCYPRVAVLEAPGADLGEVRVLASAPAQGVTSLRLSRSLVRSAMDGHLVVLKGSDVPTTHSIMTLDIKEACCAPIRVGETTLAFLYADARGVEGTSGGLSYEVVRVLSHIAGVAWANIQRAALVKRQQQLQRDLEAARRVQERMMPAPRGTVGGCEYAIESSAGRTVAGDMLDVFALPALAGGRGRVAMLLGDVMDKGAGAALLMATLQTAARHLLGSGMSAAEAVGTLNRDVAERFAPAIASLWLSIWDGTTLECVDAGHGYCALHTRHSGGDEYARMLEAEGGPLLGADPDATFGVSRMEVSAGSRLIIFSDGVPEQRDNAGEDFGTARVLSALRTSPDAASDVEALLAALEVWAHGRSFADDVSVVSVQLQ